MSKKRRMTRREFLRASAVMAAGAVSAACAPPATPTKKATPKPTATLKPEEPTATPKPAAKYNEAPMLSELVEAGELPPVDERLPVTPGAVLDVPEENIDLEIGQYGGTLKEVHINADWDPVVFCHCNEPLLRQPGMRGQPVRGNVAESFEVSEDGKVFTFHMREGMKWSDGHPVTSEDVLFAYEDVLMNEDLTPTIPERLRSGSDPFGETMDLEVLDDYTFRISFSGPYYGFPVKIAIGSWYGYQPLLKPKHFLKKFHTKYTPLEELEPLLEEEELGKDEWYTLFNTKDMSHWDIMNPEGIGFPRLSPWLPVKDTEMGWEFERNPYYWKVDSEGNQLPYIDGISTRLVSDQEARLLRIIAGEVDYAGGGDQGVGNRDFPMVKENEEKGGYRASLGRIEEQPLVTRLNLTYEDPVWREVVRNVEFRRALNMGIDRDAIISNLYPGNAAEPASRMAPGVYDPERAKQILDEIGMDQRDAEGWRLGPDGETFAIPFLCAPISSEIIPATELVMEDWKDLGVKTTLKTVDGSLWGERVEANELQADMDWGVLSDYWHHQWESEIGGWGRLWQVWFESRGEKGEEPPEEVKRFWELRSKMFMVPPDEREETFDEYVKLLHDNLFFIVLLEKAKWPKMWKNELENVPHSGFTIMTSFAAEQFFFKK